ncbi:hypothetical protein ACIQ34_09975 [Ureibacillus sp. NPDC094379]
MKKRLLTIVMLSLLLMVGCSAKTAEQHGEGISIQMSDSLDIKHITLITYVNGKEIFNENVINADNSAFSKGEVIWFDVSPFEKNSTVELAISYSKNINATQSKITNKIEISNANKWVNVKFDEDYQIELIGME